jgi:hypothetical protein
LINIFALIGHATGEVAVMVPVVVIDLDKANTPFHQPSCRESSMCESSRFLDVGPVHRQNLFWLSAQIGEFGDARLHPVGHLILSHAGLGFGITHFVEL